MKINDTVFVSKFKDALDGYIGRVKDIKGEFALVEFEFSNENNCFYIHKSYLATINETILYDDVLKFVEHIQRIKDIYNEGHKEILNYGTLCDLCIEGWDLVN